MATAVIDLDLKKLPIDITGLDHYSKALILIRFKGQPIGKTIIPVDNGRLILEDCYKQLMDAVQSTLWTTWLHDYLEWNERKTFNFTIVKATIAVCTHDRPTDLKRCLDALLKLPNDGQEILVIDNCPSTGETQILVESYGCIRYLIEARLGLNVARNRALVEARHEVVAFIDDDVVPDPGWLRAIVRNFDTAHVLCVTGLTMPLELETEAQEAFENFSPFSKGFKRIIHSQETRNPLSTGQVGAGANMALHKSVAHKVGFFDEALDAGTLTKSGGDHELFARILVSGYQIIYEPAALNWHRHRRTWNETRRTIKGYGTGVYAFWTRSLVVDHEWGVLAFPWAWFRHVQVRSIVKALFRRPGYQPLDLLTAELIGCMIGPWAYLISRRRLKKSKHQQV